MLVRSHMRDVSCQGVLLRTAVPVCVCICVLKIFEKDAPFVDCFVLTCALCIRTPASPFLNVQGRAWDGGGRVAVLRHIVGQVPPQGQLLVFTGGTYFTCRIYQCVKPRGENVFFVKTLITGGWYSSGGWYTLYPG